MQDPSEVDAWEEWYALSWDERLDLEMAYPRPGACQTFDDALARGLSKGRRV